MAAAMIFKHRRLMLVLPRQYGGKTELGVRLGEDLMSQPVPSTSLFLAKDHKSGKRATREKHLRVFGTERFSVNSDRIVKRADPRTVMNIASADKDPDRIRGGTYKYIHGSEVAFWKLDHGETIPGVYGKVIDPTTRIFDAFVLLETTLNGKNGFYDLWESADDLGFARLRVSLSQMLEMGLIPKEEFQRIKDTTLPLIFRQEFECDFITFQGRSYEEFDESIHVQEIPGPEDWQTVIMAIDWGFDPSATCVLFGYVKDDVLHVFDEIHEKRHLLENTFQAIQSVRERWHIERLSAIADHEEDRIAELELRGIPCGKASKSNVMGCRIEIKEKLWKNEVIIDPRCKFLIRDLTTATWKSNKKGENDLDYSQCTYGHFDAEAALRYMTRELSKIEDDEPEENPQLDMDQASALAWQLNRQRDGEI